MSRDLYSSLSGAVGAWKSIELVANNLANVNTTGFKASRVPFELDGPDPHPLGQVYAKAREPSRDARDGAPIADGVPTHFALQGPGYFVVRSGAETVLTRDGRFGVSPDRQLIDATGGVVQGQGGPIEIPEGETITVQSDGKVIGSVSGELDQLSIVDAEVTALGSNRFRATGPVAQVAASVIQGALEGSNVDPLGAMVELVQASRYFEMFQKAMTASDELDARLNQIGGR
ncbi:MAG: flagellar hook-basal body complex protein [Myxococcota bacterium]